MADTGRAKPSVLERIPVGPATRERAARVLQEALGAVWAGILESHGEEAGAGWRVVVADLYLEPTSSPNGAVPEPRTAEGRT